MRVDISRGWELHNIIKTASGDLRTRRALTSLKTPTGGTTFVAGFTVDCPSSTEPWHYLFEQSTTDATTTMRVFTEEFLEVFNYPLGVLQRDPVISFAVQYGQLMISSPAFSFTLYGQVGGGVVTAIPTPSQNPDTTALDVPQGHVCSFSDRTCIASKNVLFINDPPATQGQNFDPRTFVTANALPFSGIILDVFQADDGALRVFTTQGAWSVSPDALAGGQAPVGSIQQIPGVNTMRPRNACASNGQVFVLEKDGIYVLGSDPPSRLPIPVYTGARYVSQVVAVDDLRLSGEMFPTADGFIVGLRGRRDFYLDVNLKTKCASYTTGANSPLNVVGVLRSRDGETLPILSTRVVQPAIGGLADFDGFNVNGSACGRIDLVGQRPEIRRIIVTGSNAGRNAYVYVSGAPVPTGKTFAALSGEAVIGTTTWNTAPTQRLLGRGDRSTRFSFSIRRTDPQIELTFEGGDQHIASIIDVETVGQGLDREDKS